MSNKTILVTGGSGFIGKHVVSVLLSQGVRIRLVERFGKNYWSETTELEIVRVHDIFQESQEWWVECCKGVDTVIHLAWYVEPGKYLNSKKNLDCLFGSLKIAFGAATAGVRKFVGVGTCFEYDLSNKFPKSVNDRLAPRNIYSASKMALYTLLNNIFSSEKISFLWCRVFYLYGDGEDPRRLYPYLHQQLSRGEFVNLGSPTKVRDFMDVKEAAKLIVDHALSSSEGAVNICSGNGTTIKDFALSIADIYARRDLLIFNERIESNSDPEYVVGIK